jgi:hypothetical protein
LNATVTYQEEEKVMNRNHLVMLSTAFLMSFGAASFAQQFPSAPPKLKEMEATGAQRMSAEELKTFFPGVIDSKGTKGRHIITFNADGTLLRKGMKDDPGTWRIDERNNTHCRSLPKGRGLSKKGYQENCFVTFRAPDGVHYFDYDVDDGFYAHVWRKAAEQ